MEKGFFTGRKVLVMGLGRFGGGVDAVKFARRAGAEVIVTDSASPDKLLDSISDLSEFTDIEFHLGFHSHDDFKQADIIIVNPAVSPDNEYLQMARSCGKFITSQINIFFELCPAAIIGITGANGKSTTTALTAHLLEAAAQSNELAYSNIILSGNIGNQPLLADIDKITSEDLVVLELSSFQLEQLAEIQKAPHIALLTNLTPNHLDRHGTFEQYCLAKENIFKFQKPNGRFSPVSIFNAEDPIAAQWFDKYKSQPGLKCIKFAIDDINKEFRSVFSLPGRANLSNLAAALAVARCLGITDNCIKNALPGFVPLPHRLELVAEIEAIRWYNDSIATTPASTIAALDAFDEPKILIAGGYDKNLPFDELGGKIAQSAKAVILIGQTAPKIAQAIRAYPDRQLEIKMETSLTDAVQSARSLAASGDIVLLSPACASYDMFENFQQRGLEFISLVHQIAK